LKGKLKTKKMPIEPQRPSFIEERRFKIQGYRLIAGIDESGRGSLAGPVVAAAVILPEKMSASWLGQINDSKLLSPAKRDFLFPRIRDVAISIGVGTVPHNVIDNMGIIKATRSAMKLAIDQLEPQPDALLLDYMYLPYVKLPQKGIVHGDNLCFSIACASIIAKVTRDRLMIEMDKPYSGYGLARHKGYATEDHLTCLFKLGPSPIHRQSFHPVNAIIKDTYQG
jgi:ribonuclease HII